MNTLETQINIVNDKLLQLVKKIAYLQKENDLLTREMSTLRDKVKSYETATSSLNQKVMILQAVTGNMNEEDQLVFEKRIDQYIKEIDKCIGMLSE